MAEAGALMPDENDPSQPGKEIVEGDRGDGRFTLAERKEIISKRKIAEYKEQEAEIAELWDFRPKSPEQVALENSFLHKRGAVAGAALSIASAWEMTGAVYLAEQGGAGGLSLTLMGLTAVTIPLSVTFFKLKDRAEAKVQKLNVGRSTMVPRSVRKAYQSIKTHAQFIEEGNYPPDVIASARLSLEGVANHVKLIVEHTEMGTVKSEPCRDLMEEVFRIAAEMEVYLQLEQEERRELEQRRKAELEAELVNRVGQGIAAQRSIESIQQTEGLTF